MASLFAALEAWKTTARFLESFGDAYLMYRVQKIKSDHRAVNEARNELIIQINQARKERDSQKLVNYNRALHLLEHGAGLQLNSDTRPQG